MLLQQHRLPSLKVPRPFQKLSDFEKYDVKRILDAYNVYFDHIRFRRGWAEPKYHQYAIQSTFYEAAEIVLRVRNALDKRLRDTDPKAGPTLRQLCGTSQTFLHSDEGVAMFCSCRKKFVEQLVHETLKDAMGYVEGVTHSEVDTFILAVRLCDTPGERTTQPTLPGRTTTFAPQLRTTPIYGKGAKPGGDAYSVHTDTFTKLCERLGSATKIEQQMILFVIVSVCCGMIVFGSSFLTTFNDLLTLMETRDVKQDW